MSSSVQPRNPKPIQRVSGIPFIGSVFEMQYRRLAFLQRIAQECGDIGYVSFGHQRVVLVNEPTLIQDLLVNHAEVTTKPHMVRQMARRFLGQGLLSVEGAEHRQQRKQLSPLFQHRRITTYDHQITQVAQHLGTSWTTGTLLNMTHAMYQFTLDLIGQLLFAVDTRADAATVRESLRQVATYTDGTITNIFSLPSWLNPQAQRAHTALQNLDAIIYRFIHDRKAVAAERQDLLSLLLTATDAATNQPLNEQQVRDQALTFFLAGHETTANAFTWTWYLLTQHPLVYQRVREEVDRVLAGRLPTVADIPQLSSTTQVIKEALRLYPPAYLFVRETQETIQLGDYTLPRGTIVAISPYTLHRRPQAFAQPEHFNPDHFQPDAEAQRPRHAFLPFGVGPHHCIGQHLAMLELQLGIATITQQVQFELVPAQRVVPEPRTTLRPPDSLRMVVIRR